MNDKIKKLIKKHYQENFTPKQFVKGVTNLPVSGKVFNEEEFTLGVEAILDGWWTEGRFAKQFEDGLKNFLKVRHLSLTNSGSSANLLAVAALTSAELGHRALKPGDEIITTASAFPTTLNPILQYQCVPVMVDVDLKTCNVVPEQIEKAVTKKTKAIILAHTLGNPFNLNFIMPLVKKYRLWLIEDCCDALGSKYNNKLVGSFGHLATYSFYPAHQITTGEGGAVVAKNIKLHRAVRQFRDWGRGCWCDTGKDNTCGKRFDWKFGRLPFGYDHKYVYTQIGYNLKLTDMQAAIGLAQLHKLPGFIEKRKTNFKRLSDRLHNYKRYFILPEPESGSDPSWFGFMLILKDKAPFSRLQLVKYLESHRIATRSLFGGNLLLHPGYRKIKRRLVGRMTNSDKITRDGFWVGVYPGLDEQRIDYIAEKITEFVESKISSN